MKKIIIELKQARRFDDIKNILLETSSYIKKEHDMKLNRLKRNPFISLKNGDFEDENTDVLKEINIFLDLLNEKKEIQESFTFFNLFNYIDNSYKQMVNRWLAYGNKFLINYYHCHNFNEFFDKYEAPLIILYKILKHLCSDKSGEEFKISEIMYREDPLYEMAWKAGVSTFPPIPFV